MVNRFVVVCAIASTLMIVSMAMFVKFIGNNFFIGTLVTLVMFFLIYYFMVSRVKDIFSFKSSDKKKEGSKEGFTTLRLSDYPKIHSKLPLDDWYPVKNQPSNYTYSTMAKLYPRFPAKSMQTNNIRYWTNPSNGTCVIPHQCEGLYGRIEPDKFVQPTAPQWNGGLRVNFYDTCSYQQQEQEE
jgi:hypothetical protein